MIPVEYGCIPVEDIKINAYELKKRLNVEGDADLSEFEKVASKVKSEVTCKYVAVCTDVVYGEDDSLDIGYGVFKSRQLCKNLKGADRVVVFAVTLGSGVDRLLMRLSTVSAAEYFVADAVASAIVEGAMDRAEDIVKKDMKTRPRFSAGFGDFYIENQKGILKLLNAEKLLGITIGDSCLMSPMKSVTGVMGVE